ncbi:VWA domain-containing protein [Phaeodactylibacter sp.]|uniref:VWA domain-containing protein n=1 Tax=Phaeodactylibacter sp. TaxID=1940289 RepID=UPI0025E524B5|nr:VWA domain-containing protein [Phaeodactylibacter sp.]MCI4650716.1 VWA domain-containing protein [Phaeodactylibacter sp.]MCI5093058.1 VWA domain-containing protein [Phaeodactylibacter sp.]
MDEAQKTERWRLILGKQSDPSASVPLSGNAKGMDKVLEALYDSDRKGGLGSSSPNVNRWLGDIRRYFPTPVVQLMQRDALQRLGLERMLLEPELLEAIEPDVELVGTLLSLNKQMTDETRASARMVITRIVQQLEKRLEFPLKRAIRGSLDRATPNRRPRLNEINWHRTIRTNLKHYQPDYKTIIPEQLYGYGRKRSRLKDVFILADQSGSMAASVVYASILSCIMASVSALHTRFIAFDTSVADLSEHLQDPVDLLFATQLGGGTDIAKAVTYARPLIRRPNDTILVLISDLYEGGRPEKLIAQAAQIKAAGTQFIVLLALNDKGAPAYSKDIAAQLAVLDIPCFACTPEQFPGMMAAAIQQRPITAWLAQENIPVKN